MAKVNDQGRIVYKCSPTYFITMDKHYSSYFDPTITKKKLKVFGAELLSVSQISRLRLEADSIFGSYTSVDLIERFKMDAFTRSKRILMLVAVIMAGVLGMCGRCLKWLCAKCRRGDKRGKK